MHEIRFPSKRNPENEVQGQIPEQEESGVVVFWSGHFKSGDQRIRMGGREVARATIRLLFNFIDAIKYTKPKMVDDACITQ